MISTHLVMFKFLAGAGGDPGAQWEMIPPWQKQRLLASNRK